MVNYDAIHFRIHTNLYWISFSVASFVLVAVSSRAAIPCQSILGELRNIALRRGWRCYNLNFTNKRCQLLAKYIYILLLISCKE